MTHAQRLSSQTIDAASRVGIPAAQCEALAEQLSQAVGMLNRRQAASIPDGHLDDYVRLGWMRWNGGGLLLTDAGRTISEANALLDDRD